MTEATEAPQAITGELVSQGGMALDAAQTFAVLANDVPDAGQDGVDAILAQLAAVDSPAQLDAPWNSAGMGAFTNTELVVFGIRKMAAEFEGPLPFFLVVDAAVIATGERVTFTTGAVAPVAQLIKAHALRAFPLRVIPRVAERPSKAGYYPQHLEVAR